MSKTSPLSVKTLRDRLLKRGASSDTLTALEDGFVSTQLMLLLAWPIADFIAYGDLFVAAFVGVLGTVLMFVAAFIGTGLLEDTFKPKEVAQALGMTPAILGASAYWWTRYPPLTALVLTVFFVVSLVGLRTSAASKMKATPAAAAVVPEAVIARVEALPADLDPRLAAILDRALARFDDLRRYANKSLAHAGVDGATLLRDAELELVAILERAAVVQELALVAARKEEGAGALHDEVAEGLARLASCAGRLEEVAEAALLHAAADEGPVVVTPLAEHAERLRLTAEALEELDRG